LLSAGKGGDVTVVLDVQFVVLVVPVLMALVGWWWALVVVALVVMAVSSRGGRPSRDSTCMFVWAHTCF
jgi:hypothetical protein